MNQYQQQISQSNPEVQAWANTALRAYLEKHSPEVAEVEHILDFLNSDKAPKRLRRMSYAQAKLSAAKWVKALAKKGKNIDDSNAIRPVIKFKDGFKLVRLLGKEAFEREGSLMSHCVASYYGKNDSKIYSLRDPNNIPHCTIEIVKQEGKVQQIKGKGNGSIHPKYIRKVLYILKKFGMKVRESELSNLGYIVLEPHEKEIFANAGLEMKTVRFQNKEFIYVF